MILEALKLVHVVTGAIAFGAGVHAVRCILTVKPLRWWPILFLECALLASATGLLFPFHHLLPTHWAAMSVVYVSGAAVLALRKYHLGDIWSLLFALSIVLALYLCIVVAIAHVFDMLIPTEPKSFFVIAEFTVILLFAVLGLFIARMYRNSPVDSTAVHR